MYCSKCGKELERKTTEKAKEIVRDIPLTSPELMDSFLLIIQYLKERKY